MHTLVSYFKAIRAFPEEWVDEDTRLCDFDGEIHAVNPRLEPMRFDEKSGFWNKLSFDLDESKIDQNAVALTEAPPMGEIIAEHFSATRP